MAIKLDEYDKIFASMPKRNKGDKIKKLSDADESAPDAAWEKRLPKKRPGAARKFGKILIENLL